MNERLCVAESAGNGRRRGKLKMEGNAKRVHGKTKRLKLCPRVCECKGKLGGNPQRNQ